MLWRKIAPSQRVVTPGSGEGMAFHRAQSAGASLSWGFCSQDLNKVVYSWSDPGLSIPVGGTTRIKAWLRR